MSFFNSNSSPSPSLLDGCANQSTHDHHHHNHPLTTTRIWSSPSLAQPPSINSTDDDDNFSTTVLPSNWASLLPLWNGSSTSTTLNSSQKLCPPAWDGFYCWPPTPAGHQVIRSCEHIFSASSDLPTPIATIMHQQNGRWKFVFND